MNTTNTTNTNTQTPFTDTPSASTTLISPSVDSPSTISGVSGASYAPMDTTPEPKLETPLDRLLDLLNATLREIVKEVQKQPSQPQTDLEEAVDTTLESALWFDQKVNDRISDWFDTNDLEYELSQLSERYFRNSFDPSDHFDFEEAVRSRVEDEVESIIDSLVEEAVESRLADLVEEKLANANITINF